jgi:hypothetical protein
MARKTRAPGEKPLFWVASSKNDLLSFPKTVKDEISHALGVAHMAKSIPRQNHGRVKAPEYSKLWKAIGAIRIARFTQ